ncbi:MAG TPA: hypothetical protein VFE47_25860 [Tepidisphaeraceae bacterium]|jgi:hypothetical protein|nr:hypothetical protein [Tepidisphaeraceae bacterium]
MWRQGDVFIEAVDSIPQFLKRYNRLILASGDSTGQRHQIKDRKSAQLYQGAGDDLYLVVTSDTATVAHPEHAPIDLPKGNYRVWKQREFADVKPRPVVD